MSIRNIIVCADDFGRTRESALAIADLARISAISATSVLVDAPYTASFLPALDASNRRLAVGLHLNLTERWDSPPTQNTCRPVSRWILAAHLQPTSVARLAAPEIQRQLDLFERLTGAPPDFVDGHEHVHQLPGVFDSLLEELIRRYGTSVAVRSTTPRVFRGIKAGVIAGLGASRSENLLQHTGVPMNMDFAGVYGFDARHEFGGRMRQWLHTLAPDGLVMCHPEQPRSNAPNVRCAEFAFLRSEAWSRLREELGCRLIPFTCQTVANR